MDTEHPRRPFTRFFDHVRTVLWVDLPPWRMGLSAVIGASIAMTPTVGFQTVLVAALVSIVRGNRGLALVASGIANPWTIPFIYYLDYRVGALLTGAPEWSGFPGHFSLGVLSGAVVPILVGSLLVGVVCGAGVGIGVSLVCRLRAGRRRSVPA